ncbi:MAG: radical SAM protein [Duncaniella sp.]|nr:radical SAM protein [Duncaniella sp.]MDE6812329.1 radical SAM protein [Duncaniella sp.]
MKSISARISGISRHRLATDGEGVTTLVVFHGCPLRCRYCLNPHTLSRTENSQVYTPVELYNETIIDELYFIATNGGIAFGGGEPGLHPDFISEFREFCGSEWRLTLETSLNVPTLNIRALLPVIDKFVIDVKDINDEIYSGYTGGDNSLVIANLHLIAETGRQMDCLLRIPLIPGFNDDNDRERSMEELRKLGFSNFDCFTYKIKDCYGERETYL